MSGRREESMVPKAEFDSYYGRPVVKPATWKVPDVPLYFFLGGLAGASAPMAALAARTGRPGLAAVSRDVAAGAATASVIALIHDLGRPERFLNMLRVFRPTSPLSVGSWILAPFSGLTTAAAVSARVGRLRWAERLSGDLAAVLGPAMTTYTAVLVTNTATPAWHEGYRELPWVFGGSALASAGGAAMLGAPTREQAPARRVAVLGAGAELVAAHRLGHRDELSSEAYRLGRASRLLRAAKVLTVAGVGLTVAASAVDRVSGRGWRSSRTSRRWRRAGRLLPAAAGTCLLAGGLCTRFGVFYGGMASATDPKYTVVPQRERLERTSDSTPV